MTTYHLAQVNIGRIKAPLDDPRMAGFMNRLDELNALAIAAPASCGGFRLRRETRPTSVPITTTIES